MPIKKLTIAVVFGGTNTEHEVSIVSARSVISHLDQKKYRIIPIYIDKTNRWLKGEDSQSLRLLPETFVHKIRPHDISNDTIDVVFPLLHGPFGEDGSIQGLLKTLNIPFVGSDILASALCMDKVVQKQLCLQQGLPICPFTFTNTHSWHHEKESILQYTKNKLQLPLFVKPANQGSSVGVIKVDSWDLLDQSINQAFIYDTKVIIEQGVENVREIECAILGNYQPMVSVLGEIRSSNEFYDYDAKYVDGKSMSLIPAHIPSQVSQKIQSIALKAFKVLNCEGLARIDFFLNGKNFNIYLNELNTMPGFTSISMYPKLIEASGIPYPKLLDKLIDLALERFGEQSNVSRSYIPKLPWHR